MSESMKLFDDMDRADDEPKRYSEPQFSWLNRFGRPDVERIRYILESWFSRFPADRQADIRGRFRDTNDYNHRSAFLELFLHELLIRLGCCVEIHPTLSDVSTRPEFLVGSPEGDSFYIEAVLATGQSHGDAARQARMNAVYDVLNRMDSPNFFVGMRLRGYPETPPPVSKFRSFLAEQLAMLNPEEITRLYEFGGSDAIPHWPCEHEGWKIDFFPIPKCPSARGKLGVRPIGLRTEARWVDTRATLQEAIVRKAGKYGQLDLPFVIAVNALLWEGPVDQIDVEETLFGKESFNITVEGPYAGKVESFRLPDGVWTCKGGPVHTRVGAVLMVNCLLPWNVPRVEVRLWHNPWASKPYRSILSRLPQAVPREGEMELLEGESLARIFDLPEDWPDM